MSQFSNPGISGRTKPESGGKLAGRAPLGYQRPAGQRHDPNKCTPQGRTGYPKRMKRIGRGSSEGRFLGAARGTRWVRKPDHDVRPGGRSGEMPRRDPLSPLSLAAPRRREGYENPRSVLGPGLLYHPFLDRGPAHAVRSGPPRAGSTLRLRWCLLWLAWPLQVAVGFRLVLGRLQNTVPESPMSQPSPDRHSSNSGLRTGSSRISRSTAAMN